MNLVKSAWLPFRLQDDSVQELPIAAVVRPDVVDLALPRADFQGAAYQLIIGLLQTVIAPENRRQWHKLFNQPPTVETLQIELNKVEHAFNLTGDGPLFMQDFDELDEGSIVEVTGLLIDAPGENGVKNNTDHFVKRSNAVALSLPMAALALFTLQINAPSGGQGHRVGLRGGGPLTNLLMPQNTVSTLWEKLWLNIVCLEVFSYETPDLVNADIFPWLGSTKISKSKNTETYANELHPLAMYWAMPRRIRLQVTEKKTTCAVSGKQVSSCISSYKTQNYGNNYSGVWRHPLTAYRYNPKKPDEIPNSVKAQPGGITYQYWDALIFTSDSLGQQGSLNIENFYEVNRRKEHQLGYVPRLWCFGYDMDNMKARGWYDVRLPMVQVDIEHKEALLRTIKELQEITNKLRLELNKRIKEAWFERPKDAKGDTTFIAAQFWQKTEVTFFAAIQALSQQENYYPLNTQAAEAWLKSMQNTVLALFDEYTLSVDIGDPKQLKRIMQARRFLSIWLYAGKDVKNFKKQHGISDIKEVA